MLTLLCAVVSLSAMTDKPPKPLTELQQQIHDLLKAHPDGLDITQIRAFLGVSDSQEQLDRRVRTLRPYFHIPCVRQGQRYVYVLQGPATGKVGDTTAVSGKLRAEVLAAARGRCQMCGASVELDEIKLEVDHKLPRDWGGLTEIENLWAICTICNNGKQAHFSTFDADEMRQLLAHESVHERLAQALKMHLGKPVPAKLLEFVANAVDQQGDWERRLRELRVPLGLDYTFSCKKNQNGKTEVTYTLTSWKPLPPNAAELVSLHNSKKRRKQN